MPVARYKQERPQVRAWANGTDVRQLPQIAFLAGRSDAYYWVLVDQLMSLGWSRLGFRQTLAGRVWGFRLGYTLPDRPFTEDMAELQERWIKAAHEQVAMRRLLRELQGY
jgi:hypothetical protein